MRDRLYVSEKLQEFEYGCQSCSAAMPEHEDLMRDEAHRITAAVARIAGARLRRIGEALECWAAPACEAG